MNWIQDGRLLPEMKRLRQQWPLSKLKIHAKKESKPVFRVGIKLKCLYSYLAFRDPRRCIPVDRSAVNLHNKQPVLLLINLDRKWEINLQRHHEQNRIISWRDSDLGGTYSNSKISLYISLEIKLNVYYAGLSQPEDSGGSGWPPKKLCLDLAKVSGGEDFRQRWHKNLWYSLVQ